jgi:hypothetical protein
MKRGRDGEGSVVGASPMSICKASSVAKASFPATPYGAPRAARSASRLLRIAGNERPEAREKITQMSTRLENRNVSTHSQCELSYPAFLPYACFARARQHQQ